MHRVIYEGHKNDSSSPCTRLVMWNFAFLGKKTPTNWFMESIKELWYAQSLLGNCSSKYWLNFENRINTHETDKSSQINQGMELEHQGISFLRHVSTEMKEKWLAAVWTVEGGGLSSVSSLESTCWKETAL